MIRPLSEGVYISDIHALMCAGSIAVCVCVFVFMAKYKPTRIVVYSVYIF